MSIGMNRRRIFVKGLGNLEIRQTYPTPAADFSSAGFVQAVGFTDAVESEDVMDDRGDLVLVGAKTRKVSGTAALLQSSTDEFSLITDATGKTYALRYHGLAGTGFWQAFIFPQIQILPTITADYKPGARVLPLNFASPKQGDLDYVVPIYYLMERTSEIAMTKLKLWLSPRNGLTSGSVKVLDCSGFEKHGDLNASGDWQVSAAPFFLRFDGTDDYLTLGDVLDIDVQSDFMIDLWVRIPAANGTQQEILSKKSASGTSAGFSIIRNTSNQIVVSLADGIGNVDTTSAATVLQNAWTHVAIKGDRDAGESRVFINGAASGSAGNISVVASMGNAVAFYLARLGSAYGQVDIGDVRLYNYGLQGIPANIDTIIAANYAGDRAYYGV